MIDHLIKDATCQTICGKTYGTAFLIADSILLTARHCVVEAIEAGAGINVIYTNNSEKLEFTANVLADSEELDTCLLSIAEVPGLNALKLSSDLPRPGSDWQSFGYPTSRGAIGYRASGEFSQVMDTPIRKMDLDLTESTLNPLTAYDGLSGAPVVANGLCVGIVRVKMGGGIGAISIKSLSAFLSKNEVSILDSVSPYRVESSNSGVAVRQKFQRDFEEVLFASNGKYIFLEGAHGIGKTTFCKNFSTVSDKIITLGTYSLGDQTGTGPAPVVLAQPEYFFDWLSTTISSVVSGRPSRVEEKIYSKLVEGSKYFLNEFSEHCKKHSKTGVIFIDGLNEGYLADRDALVKLIGILPRSLPQDVTIVFTAPNLDQLSNLLTGYIHKEQILQLPKLTDRESASFCWEMLEEKRKNPKLISTICDKANGHPLYLRYLIEFANGSEDEELSEFPVLQGAIEEYYESLWTSLLSDSDAVNLLGLISRLRWGIPTKELVNALTPSEQAVFIPTMSRIRHLLAATDSTEVYHSSFSEFICAKTLALSDTIHEKIGRFCAENLDTKYCISNAVFHLLRTTVRVKSEAVALCSQEWIDSCVEVGVNPDTLMLDLGECLNAAIDLANAPDVFRLLLLQQRVGFRYNSLFASNAFLVAEAMIALQRPQEAIKHAIRFNRPLISIEEGLQLSYNLIEGGFQEDVLEILGPLRQTLHEYQFAQTDGITINEFVELARLEGQILIHTSWSDGRRRSKKFANILRHAIRTLEEVLGEENKDIDFYVSRIKSVVFSANLYHSNVYNTIDELKSIDPALVIPKEHIIFLALVLHEFRDYVEKYGVRNRKESLNFLFSDFATLLEEVDQGVKYLKDILSVMIELRAPSDLVLGLAQRVNLDDATDAAPFIKDNGVDVDFSAIRKALDNSIIRSFLNPNIDAPMPIAFGTHDWADSLARMIETVALCEGKARRAQSDSDTSRAVEVLMLLKSHVIDQLDFTLKERITWQDSYAIPESIIAILYQRVTIILRDCYPEELLSFLSKVLQRMSSQLGLYSEGFREAVAEVLRNSVTADGNGHLDDARYELMLALRNFVVMGVENRHELVPDLLNLIPSFASVNADQDAEEIYRHVLAVSMGPSWYKEDQFSLLIKALRYLPTTDVATLSLPKVAGFIERASGELTFQRFARYAKSELIAELCRRDLHDLARQYFQRQSCGNVAELLQDLQLGVADRISPRVGSRHPGGALDEQQAILSIVNNSPNTNWRLRFALLHVYLCGDRRHIDEYASAFANIIKRESDPGQQAAMRERWALIMVSDVSESVREEFQKKFDSILKRPESGAAEREKAQVKEKTPDSERPDNNELVMPGIFGLPSAAKEAHSKLQIAEGHLRRRNFAAARKEALASLQEYQDGGWGVWGNLSSVASRAKEILEAGNADEADLVQSYGILIKNEEIAEKSLIAEHFFEKIEPALSAGSAISFWNHTLNHIELLTGNSENEINLFEFLSKENVLSADEALFEILLSALDHPQWLRRERASVITLWLMENEEIFFNLAAKEAFSMVQGNRGDVVGGAIDVLSKRNPLDIWARLSNAIDLSRVVSDCKNVGRVVSLFNVATRAANSNDKARQIKQDVISAFRPGAVELDQVVLPPNIPKWAQCIKSELNALHKIGALSSEILTLTEDFLNQLCAPQSIQEAWELENAVSLSFREPNQRVLNRWTAIVRHALSCTIFSYASQRNFEKIGNILRIYNPSAPELKMDTGFSSLGNRILNAVTGQGDYQDIVGTNDYYFLSYCEFAVNESTHESELIEVFATLISNISQRERALAASTKATFHTKNLPSFGGLGDVVGPSCLRPIPDRILFGAFSAGIPSPSFMGISGVNGSDILQKIWRNGRSFEVQDLGKPENEGSMVGVRKSALRLPGGSMLVWTVMVNNEVVLMVDNNLKKLM